MSEHVQEPEPRQDEATAPDETSTARGPTMATALSPAAVASTFWVVAGLVAPEAQSVSPGLRSSPLLAEDGRPLAERT